MAVGFNATRANVILDAEKANWTHVQLHVGDPGANGTANPAGNSTRKAITWGAASGGSVATSADISWSDAEVNTSEDYTHFSTWSASSAGTFGFSGGVTANPLNATGDAFTIPASSLTISLIVAS